MLKLLLLIGVLTAVYFLFFKKKSVGPSPRQDSQEDAMIPCAECGTYVQLKEALMKDGKYFCSKECMEKE